VTESKTHARFVALVRSRWFPPMVVLAASLALRLIFLAQFSSFPLFKTNIMDMEYFHRLATEGIPDTGFPSGAFFKAPLYPLFLKVIYTFFGTGPWAPRIFQIILGSLTALLTYMIAVRAFSRRVAFIAGMMVALSGSLILFDGQLLAPTLAIFLNLAAVYLLLEAWSSNKWSLYLASGFLFGLSAVTRPTVLLAAAGLTLLLLWLRRSEFRRDWKQPACLVAGLLLAIAPVTVRNYIETHEFVLIGAYSGINLYIGNNPQSDGVSATVPGTGLDWWHGGTMDDTRRIADQETGRELSTAEQSTYWRNRAIKEILADPGLFATHVGRKFLLFLGGYELANNFDIRYLSKRIGILNYLILRKPVYWPWGILLPLGVCGMILVNRWRPEKYVLLVFLAFYLPAFLLYFVTARYRLPMIPFLAIFAAAAIDSVLNRLSGLSLRRAIIGFALLIVLVVVGRLDPLGYASGSEAQGHQMMAAMYDQEGDTLAAEHYYRLALEADPTLPNSNNDLGLLLLHRGDTAAAIRHLEKAVRYSPDEWLIQYNLGVAYKMAGRWQDAINQYRRVLKMAPEMHEAVADLAVSWLTSGHPDSALTYYRQLLDLYPDDYLYHFSAGLCYQILGMSDSALAQYRRTVELEPDYSQVYYNLGRYWIESNQPDSARVYLSDFLDHSHDLPSLEAQARLTLDSLGRK